VVCLLVPVAAVAMIPLLLRCSVVTAHDVGKLANLFVVAWPLVMMTIAGLRSYLAVRDEKTRGTAWQLAVTPIARRVIAAAKVLPYVLPAMCGTLAALILYLVAGAVGSPTVYGMPSPFLILPFRVLGGPFVGLGVVGPDLFTIGGGFAGLIMCMTDLGWVWVAAHWGTTLGLRYDNMLPAMGHFSLRLLRSLCIFVGYMGLGLLAASPFILTDKDPSITFCIITPVFLLLWWHRWLCITVRRAVDEFETFDRLVID
jgi:hypothetical protein